MGERRGWIERIEGLLRSRNVLFLSGVRRSGKTTLCRSLLGARYFDCELPRIRRDLDDAEVFFRRLGPGTVVLDEIHRLPNPSEPLKIAADHFPDVKVVATGSSTLAARRKFQDTLTGRKHELWLTPMTRADAFALGDGDLDRRMLHGGLPPFFLADRPSDLDYGEWLDSYWAKDLAELFVVDKKTAFLRFVELLFAQSGERFEANAFAAPCEIARPTVQHYLSILETTLLATRLPPYAGRSARELRAQPKVYAFDTGFVSYVRGDSSLTDDARGRHFEHLVLGELSSELPRRSLHHWRDKQGHEVDFVVAGLRGRPPLAIECNLRSTKFTANAMASFRRLHPEGANWLVARDVVEPTTRRFGELIVELVPLEAVAAKARALAEASVNPQG